MNKEEIIEMARRAGFERLGHTAEDWVCHLEDIEEFTKLVAEHEREACLKICERQASTNYWEGADVCADAIRARGQE